MENFGFMPKMLFFKVIIFTRGPPASPHITNSTHQRKNQRTVCKGIFCNPLKKEHKGKKVSWVHQQGILMEKKMITRDGNDDDVSSNPKISLPDNLVFEILSRLPVKSLMRFKCACQSWLSFIENDPYFIDLHFNRSKAHSGLLLVAQGKSFWSANLFEGRVAVHTIMTKCPTGDMLSPINGLICFFTTIYAGVRIYNLGTRELTPWIDLTVQKELLGKKANDELLGKNANVVQMVKRPNFAFGFDPVTKEHKVICLCTMQGRHLHGRLMFVDRVCELLTVGQNLWRRFDDVPPYVLEGADSVCVNGVIYWRNGPRVCPCYEIESDEIVAFDLGSEKFRVIRIPDFMLVQPQALDIDFIQDQPQALDELSNRVDLLEVDGRLALLRHRKSADIAKLWIFDDDKNNQSTTTGSNNWIEETILLPFGSAEFNFQAVAGTDQIIITTSTNSFIYFYDRRQKTLKEVEISGISSIPPPPTWFMVRTFFESLLPVQQRRHQTEPLALSTSKLKQVSIG